MSFVGLKSFFSFIAVQLIPEEPGLFGGIGSVLGNLVTSFFQSACTLFYGVCKWFLAVVDFLQYFIQKLIGLDYWLDIAKGAGSTNAAGTIDGAIEADLLFSFLYSDSVQAVFRAMIGLFVILLIIFTIFQIIKQEWAHATGGFEGDGNSKIKIFRSSFKAILLVIAFPLIMIIGILSSNAILASLVNALNINMSQTFGSTLFELSAQSANRYRIYADSDQRTATSQKINIYVSGDKTVYYGSGSSIPNREYIADLNDYLDKINHSNTKKYTIDTMFKLVNPRKMRSFNGFCIGLGDTRDERKYFLVACDEENKVGTFHYLRDVLQAKIIYKDSSKNKAQGITGDDQYDGLFDSIKKEIQSEPTSGQAYIKGLYLHDFGDDTQIIKAAYNTWNYASIYKNKTQFNQALNYQLVNSTQLDSNFDINLSYAKMFFNADIASTYFDGGQFGVVQKQSEYYVMADVVDFMNSTNQTLYIMDATSSMINWEYDGHQIDTVYKSGECEWGSSKYTSFIVNYSDRCEDSEEGYNLYLAKHGAESELDGALYIMCYKVKNEANNSTKYIPLVHGRTFTDPVTGKTYTFKSNYLADTYKGVVVAKGIFETNSTNASLGEPTYLKTSATVEKNEDASKWEALFGSSVNNYYYNLSQDSVLGQYSKRADFVSKTYQIKSINASDDFKNVMGIVYEEKDSDGNEVKAWRAVKSDLTTFPLSSTFMKSLTFNLLNGSSRRTATYSLTFAENNNLHLYSTTDGYMFVVEMIPSASVFRVHGVGLAGGAAGPSLTISDASVGQMDHPDASVYKNLTACGGQIYNVCMSYQSKSGTEVDVDDGSHNGVTYNLNINEVEFVKDVEIDHDSDPSTPKIATSMFTGQNKLNLGLWFGELKISAPFNFYMDKQTNGICSLNGSVITFATPSNYHCQSIVYKLDLYDFYTAKIGDLDSNDFQRYDVENDKMVEVEADDLTEESIIKFAVDVNDFKWEVGKNNYALYNGKEYVATMYKNIADKYESGDLTKFFQKFSMEILYDYNTYYNINNQNRYSGLPNALTYYRNLKKSLMIGSYRDNLGGTRGSDGYFGNMFVTDYHIDLFGGWRFKTMAGVQQMSYDNMAGYFTLEDGITYDYFFERTVFQQLNHEGVGLETFFIPSKIAYWILLISSVLIIKILGTALWGVIKRFYEITLYFIAMPAVASTIPLDEGGRFKTSITQPLLEKVMGTYGVILGINVFFVLLAPVKSLSQVFTEEDIATSGSYFLKHLPIPVDLLNGYIYIMFVLVAFTLLGELPGVITRIIGVDKNGSSDILKSGEATKKSVGSTLKSAGDMISGRSIAQAAGNIGSAVGGMIPGSHFIGKGVEKMKGFGKGAEGEGGAGGGKPRTGDGAPDDGGQQGAPTESETGEKKVGGSVEGATAENGVPQPRDNMDGDEVDSMEADPMEGGEPGVSAENAENAEVKQSIEEMTDDALDEEIASREETRNNAKDDMEAKKQTAEQNREAMNQTKSEIDELNARKQEINNDSSLTAEEKAQKINEINREIIDKTRTYNEQKELSELSDKDFKEAKEKYDKADAEVNKAEAEKEKRANPPAEENAEGAEGGETGEAEGGKGKKKKFTDLSIEEMSERQIGALKWLGGKAADGVKFGASWLGNKAGNAVKTAGKGIAFGAKAVVTATGKATKFVAAKVNEKLEASPTFQKIKSGLTIAKNAVKGVAVGAKNVVKGVAIGAKNVAVGVGNWTSTKFKNGMSWVSEKAHKTADGFRAFKGAVKELPGKIGMAVKGTRAFKVASGIASGIGKGVKGAAKGIKIGAKVAAATALTITKPFRKAGKAVFNGAAKTYGALTGRGLTGEAKVKHQKRVKTVKTGLKVAGLVGLGALAMAVPGGLLTVGAGMGLAKGAKHVVKAGVGVAQRFAGGVLTTAQHLKKPAIAGAAMLAGATLGVGAVAGLGAVGVGVLVSKSRKAKKARAGRAIAFAEENGGTGFTHTAGSGEGRDTSAPQTSGGGSTTRNMSEHGSTGFVETDGNSVQGDGQSERIAGRPRSRSVNGVETGDEFATPGRVFDSNSRAPRTTAEAVTAVANGTAQSASVTERVARTEFDRKSLDDHNFVDDKIEARANVVRNRADSKIGNMVATQVLQNMGTGSTVQEKVDSALNGANGKQGLLTEKMRMDAYMSALGAEERARVSKMSAEQQAAFFKEKNFALQTNVGADGKVGFSVSRSDALGAVALDKKATGNILSQVMSSEGVSSEAINTAIEQTHTTNNIDEALSKNLALGVNYSTQNASTTTSLTASSIYERASANDDIVAEAMIRSMETNPKSATATRFKEELGISDISSLSDPTERARVVEQIKIFKNSTNSNVINTMDSSVYAQELTNTVRDQVQTGKFKVTAWDVADNDTKNRFREKTRANLDNINNNSILKGATKTGQNAIIANTTKNIMRSEGGSEIAKKIQSTAFISNVTDQEIQRMDASVIKALTGKEDVSELTNADKERIGFAKASRGGNFDNINVQEASSLARKFNNTNERTRAFNNLSNETIANAVEKSGQLGAIGFRATQDASLAMGDGELATTQAKFVLAGGVKNENVNMHLQNMYKEFATQNGLDANLANATQDSLEKFFANSPVATNMIKTEMNNEGFDFRTVVNENYQTSYSRTRAEAEKETELSMDMVRNDSPEAIFRAFRNSNVENKSTITDEIFRRSYGLNDTSSSAYQSAKAGLETMFNKEELTNFMTSKGYSEDDLVTAYSKAQLVLGTVNSSNLNLDNIQSFIDTSPEMDKKILTEMERTSDATQFRAMSETLLQSGLTKGQQNHLARTVAKNGWAGISADEKLELESRGYTEESLAGASYYELKQRLAGKSSREVYESIRTQVNTGREVDKFVETQGDLVDTEAIKTAIDGGASEEATTYVADAYAGRVSMLSEEEQQDIRRGVSLNLISGQKKQQIVDNPEFMQERERTVNHALYTEFTSNETYSAEVDRIRKSRQFKEAKERAGDNFDEEAYIVKEIEEIYSNTGLFGSENHDRIEKIKQSAKDDFIISKVLEEDSSFATRFATAGDDAVALENKRRIATIRTSENNVGAIDRVNTLAKAIEDNPAMFAKANLAFRNASGGKDLADVDLATRNNYLANEFGKQLTGRDREWFDRESRQVDIDYVRRNLGDIDITRVARKSLNGTSNGAYTSIENYLDIQRQRGISLDQALMEDGIMTSSQVSSETTEAELDKIIARTMTQEEFDSIYTDSKRENYGEETDVFRRVRRGIIESEIASGDAPTPSVNIENMSPTERAQYNYNQNLIRQSIRNEENPTLLANAFRNINLIQDRKVLEKLYAVNNLGSTEGKTIAELKNAKDDKGNFILTDQMINAYLKGHEEHKDKLIDHVSADARLGMDAQTQNQRQREAVLGNTALTNTVAVNMFNNNFTGKERDRVLAEEVRTSVKINQVRESAELREHLGLKVNATDDEIAEALQRKGLGLAKTTALNLTTGPNGGQYFQKDQTKVINAVKNNKMMLASLGLDENATDADIKRLMFGKNTHKNSTAVLAALAGQNNFYHKDLVAAIKKDSKGLASLGLKANASDAEILNAYRQRANMDLARLSMDFMLSKKQNRTAAEDAALALSANTAAERQRGYQYIHENESEVVNSAARRQYFRTGKNGQLQLREGNEERFDKAIEDSKQDSKLFRDGLYKQVTRVINPANHTQSTGQVDFFRSQGARTVTSSGGNITGVKSAFNSFMEDSRETSRMRQNSETRTQMYWFRLTKKLPEQSVAYDNWNTIINKKITDAKNGAGDYEGMSREQRRAEVERLVKQLIDTNKLNNLANMSPEERREFTEQQNILKEKALTTIDFSKIYKVERAYSASEASVARRAEEVMGHSMTYVSGTADSRERHRQNLAEIDEKIDRFNATRAMRNRNVDFGSNFSSFANSYFGKNKATRVVNQANGEFINQMKQQGVKINKDFKFEELDAKQQKLLIQIREDTFAKRMNLARSVAVKKVARDDKAPKSYLEEKGIETGNVRYQDATKKYVQMQSRLGRRISATDKAIIAKYEKEYQETGGNVSPKTLEMYRKTSYYKNSAEKKVFDMNQARAYQEQGFKLEEIFEKITDFNASFKGTKEEYASQFKAQFGDLADKIYASYGKKLSRTDGHFVKLDLAASPVSVQRNAVEKYLREQRQKIDNHMKYNSYYVPATSSNSSMFIGKTLGHAKSLTEIKIDKANAVELNRMFKLFNEQKAYSTYDSLFNKLSPALQEGFKVKNRSSFKNMTDAERKEELGNYLQKQLTRANNKVHNNNFFRSDVGELQKLNGIYVQRNRTSESSATRELVRTMTPSESKIYNNIVNNYNSAKSKFDAEQINYEQLGRALKDVTSGVQNANTRAKASQIREQIDASSVKLNVYRSLYEKEERRRKTFENTILNRNANLNALPEPINQKPKVDLFDRYKFPRKGPDGRREFVDRDSKEGKEINRAVDKFMSNHIDNLVRLKYYLDKYYATQIERERSAIYRNIDSIIKKQNLDLGRTMKDIDRIERLLRSEIRRLESNEQSESKGFKRELENAVSRMDKSTQNLESSISSLGVRLSDVSLIKETDKK